ncbi:MAG: serpin family protein [Saprospirales bacterium]|nr:MAG: serpin family protein [Saprospirales bacterium]
MIRKTALLILFLTTTFFITSCEKNNDKTNPIGEPGEIGNIPEFNQLFAWDLFPLLVEDEQGENVLISPWSIQTALNMALNAADERTLEQMLAVLHCPKCPVNEINHQQSELRIWLEEKSGHPRLTSANALFYDDQRLLVKEDFLAELKNHYNGASRVYPFAQAGTVDKINNWVKDNTNGKIDGIIERITNEDIAFLINALHFKADWLKGFDHNMTRVENFFPSEGSSIQRYFLNADGEYLNATVGDFAMVDLPFRDSTYSLSLIKHNRPGVVPVDWVRELNMTLVNQLYEKLESNRILLSFPKLKLSFETDLPEALKQLGMTDAFEPQMANFKPLGQPLTGPNVYINQIRHKAVLEVDEKGAEGAAVTSIGFGVTSLPPSFIYDQPFVLILRHNRSNTYIFQGLVEEPVVD